MSTELKSTKFTQLFVFFFFITWTGHSPVPFHLQVSDQHLFGHPSLCLPIALSFRCFTNQPFIAHLFNSFFHFLLMIIYCFTDAMHTELFMNVLTTNYVSSHISYYTVNCVKFFFSYLISHSCNKSSTTIVF